MLKKLYFLLAATCFIAIIINSCKKDSNTAQQDKISDPVIAQAKNWYESTYPATNIKLSTLATGSHIDLSQLIKPDWQHNASYTRFNRSVLELPVDASSVKTAITLSNSPSGNPVYKKEYSRSSFLTLNNGSGYKAYVMTVIADSSYLKGDLTKLDHNKYNKHDADFSGAVIYSTPKGAFVSGWFYKNGSITGKISFPKIGAGHSSTVSKAAVNSLKTNMLNCVDWYQAYYVNGNLVLGEYLGSTGDCSEDTPVLPGSGGGNTGGNGDGNTGGGGVIPPGDPCAGLHSVSPTQAVNSIKEINIVNPNPPDGSPNPPGDGGFPPPEPDPQPSPCVVSMPPPGSDDTNDSGNRVSTDCGSFNFTKTSIANWQEAGVRQIRLKWVWLDGKSIGQTRTVYLPSVVFGLPTQYQNTDGTVTTLSPGAAAVKAAKATEAAKILTYVEFRNSPYVPSDAEVLQYFKGALATAMAAERGTAGATGSGSSAIVFRNEERSDIFPYSCD
ncbi:hypothetical protein [Mucilaginibacter sp. SG564]|uniref:hypothetical protein n=1 Tax=unclassified Mucilaginibacter TaxID=2617802 RepID=UPI001555EDB2|nr:hypothetical protein [Mucilaginibacter sp. SG564]NOW94503.1 hypothetical protein [Mucilaginibacter sp. SG564]